jgi:hypothetical protein
MTEKTLGQILGWFFVSIFLILPISCATWVSIHREMKIRKEQRQVEIRRCIQRASQIPDAQRSHDAMDACWDK